MKLADFSRWGLIFKSRHCRIKWISNNNLTITRSDYFYTNTNDSPNIHPMAKKFKRCLSSHITTFFFCLPTRTRALLSPSSVDFSSIQCATSYITITMNKLYLHTATAKFGVLYISIYFMKTWKKRKKKKLNVHLKRLSPERTIVSNEHIHFDIILWGFVSPSSH